MDLLIRMQIPVRTIVRIIFQEFSNNFKSCLKGDGKKKKKTKEVKKTTLRPTKNKVCSPILFCTLFGKQPIRKFKKN